MKKGVRLTSIIVLLASLVFTGQSCGSGSDPAAEQALKNPINIVIWGVFDGIPQLETIMNNYRELHSNISFSVRTLRPENYKDELVLAIAESRAPDIVFVQNTRLPEFERFLSPMPTSVRIPSASIVGSIKKETVYSFTNYPLPNVKDLRNNYIDLVADHAVYNGKVMGIPLGIDTLAMYFNRDLFNAAGIPEPPPSWREFQTAVEKLTSVNADSEIIQSGAAIGTGFNVERSFDILSLLMMQNGTEMLTPGGKANFASVNKDGSFPALQALNFYTDFANPGRSTYTWNADMPSSFDAFTSGQTAIFFGYPYHDALIRAKAGRLNYDVAKMPQILGGQVVNYGNFWMMSVTKASPATKKNWAWDFIRFASSPEQVHNYLAVTRKPPAIRSLVTAYSNSEQAGPFAQELLTAKNWFQGKDISKAEQAFNNMIERYLKGDFEEVETFMRIMQETVNTGF